MTKPKLPRLYAECELCATRSWNFHPPESIGWDPIAKMWLCSDCWLDLNSDKRARPLVYAKDTLDDTDTMERRMLAAMTARRMGV